MNLLNMLFQLIILVLTVTAQETSNSTNAPVTQANPSRTTFQAVLQVDRPVQGQLTGVSNDNGTGVNFNVNFFDFPDVMQGPFKYHIHEYPVPASGNCTATGGHLSPFGRQDDPACDPTAPWTCQPGDLSGKHGNTSHLTSSASADSQAVGTFQAMYLDLYVSTDPSNAAFFGNRSVVVHSANGTRLNCGNFVQMMTQDSTTGGNSNETNTTAPTTSQTNNVAAAVGAMSWESVVVFAAGLSLLTIASSLI
ncbi:uncharacterized protein Z519_03626 [Cladophialophora bantiana CBS 173.52]|uniref:superoxide dismutase n=1 Tax=Cladophialophora bantiana (strain ATCC 10958 / CBS 173.52 / CDC B-1940 / NIH 8579) TaxID=1442370 RepID=A0A0D2HVT7_CLAB1|nr:uncharacterized protein Z519_03626 [Cladophialophora bantiana CBS 173.52]KIW95045.1 hypothetical protein Z519_03626 [Cladophialophora bantiana CBS 173.52]